jgi:putative RecB family exonuclease
MAYVACPFLPACLPLRIETFTSCPLLFRFSSIDKLPEPSSVHAVKGSLVHRALELLFCAPAAQRTSRKR